MGPLGMDASPVQPKVFILSDEPRGPWLEAVTSALEETGIAWARARNLGGEVGRAEAGEVGRAEGGEVEEGLASASVVILASRSPKELAAALGDVEHPVVILPLGSDPSKALELAKEAVEAGQPRVPAGSVGINVARNAGLAAARIIGSFDVGVAAHLEQLAREASAATRASDAQLQAG
jgi:hypothetical protein